MSKAQTRKSVSLSKAIYTAAAARAAVEGVACSEWVTRLIRQAIPDLPETVHASGNRPAYTLDDYREQRRRVRLDLVTGDSFDRGETCTAPAQRSAVTRAELDRMAAERKLARTVPPGTYCANCIDRRATHYGRVDLSGDVYALCDVCELPAHEVDGCRGYEPSGGLPTRKEIDAGARRAMGDEEYERTAEIERRAGMTPGHALSEEERFDADRRYEVGQRWRTGANARRVGSRERKVY